MPTSYSVSDIHCFLLQMLMNVPLKMEAAMTNAAILLAAITANVQLARNWGKMENHVKVKFHTVSLY